MVFGRKRNHEDMLEQEDNGVNDVEMVVAINKAHDGYKAPSSGKARTVMLDECAMDRLCPKLTIHEEEEEEETKDAESFDPIAKTPGNSDDEGNDENLGLNVGSEEGQDAEDDEDELYIDVNINLEGRDVQMTDVHTTQEFEDTHVTLTPVNHDGQQQSSSVSSQFVTSMLNPTPDAGIDSLFETTSHMDVPAPTTVASLTLSAPTLTPPTIPTISTVPQAPTPPKTAPSTLLQDLPNFGSLFGFDHRLKTLEANFYEFVQTNQFAGAVSSILGIVQRYMDQRMNKAVKTSYDVVDDLSEMELKKILIEKMESNKSIHRSDKQRNLYKALVEAYEYDKIILDTYGYIVTLKRRRDDDADKDEEPSAGSDRGSKSIQSWISDLAKQADSRSSFNELMDTPVDFSAFLMNRLKVDTLTSKLLAGPTYELMKGSCKSLVELEFFLEEPLSLIPNSQGRRVIPFDHFINNDLGYLRGGASSRKYTTSVTKTKAANYGYIKWIEDLVPRTMWSQEPVSYEKHALWGISHWGHKRQQLYRFAVNRESARDVYSKRRIIAVTELQIVEWHNYKHLDWITVCRDDDKLYKFKEGDFKRLRIQDIKDMLLLLLGVESYQKKLNLTKPDTYHFDLKRKEAYTAYSNPRGFIYQNKDMQNRLMRIDELHKFSDGTLNDVRTALDDCLKGIRMMYLPQAIWRKSDKEKAAAIIRAIDKQLKTRRIMRSLEKFFGGKLYEGDFRMLQRTI
nr:hypothetical protein [Tanacetum cinerariifolium]